VKNDLFQQWVDPLAVSMATVAKDLITLATNNQVIVKPSNLGSVTWIKPRRHRHLWQLLRSVAATCGCCNGYEGDNWKTL
jgi:hypothetical protein